jgi:hypothetical protein
MNDLSTIDRLGPASTPLSDTTLAAARARLDVAIAGDHRSREPRPQRRLPLLAAVAVTAAGLAVGPALIGTDGAIALAAVDPMTFPWTPGSVLPGLGEPVFEKDPNFIAARYGDPLDGVSVTTDVADNDFWTIPEAARSADVKGEEATVYESTVYDGTAEGAGAVTVVWKDEDNDWTAVTGSGRYADGDRMVTFAEALLDEPQPVDLNLSVAPSGWSVAAYKDDRVVTLSESGDVGPHDLTIVLTDSVDPDLSGYAASEVSTAVVHGLPSPIGQQDAGGGLQWILEAKTASGQPFSLQAPVALTRDQVIEIAESVTYEQ